MSAELVDPFAPAPQPFGEDDITRIRELIQERRFEDPAMFPEMHWIQFGVLSAKAKEGDADAIAALRLLEQRADFGGPLAEFPRGGFDG